MTVPEAGAAERITIEGFRIDEAPEVLPYLQDLLDGAYHDSHMFRDLERDITSKPPIFRLFVARSAEPDSPALGTAVVEAKTHEAFDYLGHPPIHIKRFTVDADARGAGLGQRLLAESTQFAFGGLGIEVLFGESNEVGALNLYGREGALYCLDSITEYWRRNTPEQAQHFFAMDISDERRRAERYPNGQGIRFAFPAGPEAEQHLVDNGYASQAELLASAGIEV